MVRNVVAAVDGNMLLNAATTAPQPATLGLLAIGGVVLIRRKRSA